MSEAQPITSERDVAINHAKTLRQALDTFEKQVWEYRDLIINTNYRESGVDKNEMISNVIIAYRHVEDARMRLGKVIQAASGGESVYDKAPEPHETTPEPENVKVLTDQGEELPREVVEETPAEANS